LLHKYWQSEIIADRLYGFLATRSNNIERKEIIRNIGMMEQRHATVWNQIAAKSHGVSFDVSPSLRLKILLVKLLSLILPFTIFIHYNTKDILCVGRPGGCDIKIFIRTYHGLSYFTGMTINQKDRIFV